MLVTGLCGPVLTKVGLWSQQQKCGDTSPPLDPYNQLSHCCKSGSSLILFVCFLLGCMVQAAGGPTGVQIKAGFSRPLCPWGLSNPGSCCAWWKSNSQQLHKHVTNGRPLEQAYCSFLTFSFLYLDISEGHKKPKKRNSRSQGTICFQFRPALV